jgi:4-hydroxy-4-methyl-2-oxoglutarate aldolase
MEKSRKGDVLVIDNAGRTDEACIGDLVTLEAREAGLAGIVIWGCHRDTGELREIGLPIFSLGPCSAGPTRLRPRSRDALKSAQMGRFRVSRDDVVFGVNDGVLFVSERDVAGIVASATKIGKTERQQAVRARKGRSLRDQFRFAGYLRKRAHDPSYTFRKHLRAIGGAVEE